MYLQKIFDKRRNKTYLSVARGYRDENGKTKHKTVNSNFKIYKNSPKLSR